MDLYTYVTSSGDIRYDLYCSVTEFHSIVFNCLCCFGCFMAPIIVSSLILYAPGIFLSDLCVCIKSHDLYHVIESPLNLCW